MLPFPEGRPCNLHFTTKKTSVLKRWTCAILSTSLLFLCCHATYAEEQKLAKPQVETFRLLLVSAENESYDIITQLLPSLGTIPDEIKADFGVDVASEIRIAVKAGKKPDILSALHKLIFFDLQRLIRRIKSDTKESPRQWKEWLTTAYLDYRLLSPTAMVKRLETDSHIKELWREAASVLTINTSIFAAEGRRSVDKKALLNILEEIESECLKIFPDFAVHEGIP